MGTYYYCCRCGGQVEGLEEGLTFGIFWGMECWRNSSNNRKIGRCISSHNLLQVGLHFQNPLLARNGGTSTSFEPDLLNEFRFSAAKVRRLIKCS